MKPSKAFLILALASALAPLALKAQQSITFDLTQILNGATSYSDTVSGLKMDLTTSDDWDNTGGLRINSSGLYVVAGSSYGNSMTFTFDQDIQLSSFTKGAQGGSVDTDALEINFNSGGSTITEFQDIAGANFDSNDFSFTFSIEAGDAITFTNRNPDINNAAFITSDLTVTVVPEPATYGLILAGASLFFLMLRRRRC